MKNILLIFVCIVLSGCSLFGYGGDLGAAAKPELVIEQPEPLKLYQVDWEIMVLDGVPYYTLTEPEFIDLSKNSEIIQNRLKLDSTVIQQYKNYYKK